MNPYSFIQSRRSVVATNLNGTKNTPILDLEQADQRKCLKEEYIFHPDQKFTDARVPHIVSASVTLGQYSDGKACNRLVVKYDNRPGRTYRVYGTEKEILPPKDLTSDEIAKLKFGYCTTADVIATERDGNDDIVAIYANLA